MDVVIGLLIFVLGGCVGSFLNVVIYRLPRGETLLGFSRCPKCQAAIAPQDNIPVLAWLLLRGRCRRCGQSISARYPIVEFVVGAMFLGLAVLEWHLQGWNLPGYDAAGPGGFSAVIALRQWDLVRIYGYHVSLLCVLLAAAMILFDGHAIPRKLLGFALLIGLAMPALWPDVHPVACCMPTSESAKSWIERAGTSVIGLITGAMVGAVLGWLAGLFYRGGGQKRSIGTETAALVAVVGLYLGWQASLSTGVLAAGLLLAARLIKRESPARSTHGICIFLAAGVQISLWPLLMFA